MFCIFKPLFLRRSASRIAVALMAVGTSMFCAGPALSDPALWRARDDDSTLYLFGTIHLLPENFEWSTPRLRETLGEAERIYLETPGGRAAETESARLLPRYGILKRGQSLMAELEPDEVRPLVQQVNALNLDLNEISQMRPWFASVYLSVHFALQDGYRPEYGADAQIERNAFSTGKTLLYFETIDDQLSMFANLPKNTEKRLLLSTLRQIRDEPDVFDEMVAAWAAGDVATIDQTANDDLREIAPKAYEALIAKRNKAWARELAKELKGSGVAFVAVGAAHLAGEDSLVTLLEKRGYAFERVDSPPAAAVAR